MKKSDLAWCIMCKGDEEVDKIARVMGDLEGYVGKFFIVGNHKPDTKLKALVKKYKGEYSFFKWTGDFSACRNFMFDQVPEEFKIVAWCDSDDRIPNARVIPDYLEALDSIDWIFCTYNYAFNQWGDVITKHIKPRFFKRGTGKWQASPHEDYVPLKHVKSAIDTDFAVETLQFNHDIVSDGTNNFEEMERRARRNLEIMGKELERDGDKTDLWTIQNIGMTFISLGEYRNAIAFLMRHFKGTGAKEDKFWSLKRAAFCHKMLGEYDQALNLLLEGLKFYPQWQTMYFDIAAIYSIQKKYNLVIDWTLTGMNKQVPNTSKIVEPLDYDLNPMGVLADAYLMINEPEKALKIANTLKHKYPRNGLVKELVETAECACHTENFVKSFVAVADEIRKNDRMKAVKLFECLPNRLDEDIRIQTARQFIVPPKQWSNKSIVIFCGNSLEDWAYPSVFTGIGGSEAAVIYMSKELVKLGYEVTVYNKCGDLRGTYDGVEYLPFYHFNPQDNFNTLIGWRNPRMFETNIKAKKRLVWLHDIASPWQFSDEATKNTDKFMFVSKWHRKNMPKIPDSKVFITNNGIDPEMFKNMPEVHCDVCDSENGDESHEHTKFEKNPNSLCWSSSYDRGLLPFIKNILPLVKKEIPDVTLEVAYGWGNIDKEMEILPELCMLREELTPLLENTDGITHHGRLNEKEVADMYKRSMVMAYASEFGETNNISSQKAQASDCYVLTTQQAGATPEYLKFGEAIPFDNIYTDKKAQEVYAQKVVEYLKNPKTAPEGISGGFSWGTTAKTWQEIL